MSKDTRFLFEVTPKHPTRKVYDSVLYPDGFSYVQMMTIRQAVAAFNTCNALKVQYNDAWYPVTVETIDVVMGAISADKAPDGVDAVEAGVRTLASYISAIDQDKTLIGQWTTKMLADVNIENSEATGVMYYVEGFKEFNGDVEEEQKGYFFPFAYIQNQDFTDAKMRVINGKNPTKYVNLDTENLIWVGGTQKAGETKIIEISAKDKDGNDVVMTIRVCHVKFEDEDVVITVATQDTDETAPAVDENGILSLSGNVDDNGVITL